MTVTLLKPVPDRSEWVAVSKGVFTKEGKREFTGQTAEEALGRLLKALSAERLGQVILGSGIKISYGPGGPPNKP